MDAEDIALGLSARRSGAGWAARCPAHDDRTPSLSIGEGEDGKPLVRCFAGCDQDSVIAALRDRGLWPVHGRGEGPSSRINYRRRAPDAEEQRRRVVKARVIWRETRDLAGTAAERYLRETRCISHAPFAPDLRFHPRLWHPLERRATPALVAAARDEHGDVTAIQDVHLAADGRKADVREPKITRGVLGGSAIRLAEPGGRLAICEGVEDALSIIEATGLPTWAALGAGNLIRIRLPYSIRDVVVAADADAAGMEAARRCACRLAEQGRRVSIARPADAKDFNELLMRQGGAHHE